MFKTEEGEIPWEGEKETRWKGESRINRPSLIILTIDSATSSTTRTARVWEGKKKRRQGKKEEKGRAGPLEPHIICLINFTSQLHKRTVGVMRRGGWKNVERKGEEKKECESAAARTKLSTRFVGLAFALVAQCDAMRFFAFEGMERRKSLRGGGRGR